MIGAHMYSPTLDPIFETSGRSARDEPQQPGAGIRALAVPSAQTAKSMRGCRARPLNHHPQKTPAMSCGTAPRLPGAESNVISTYIRAPHRGAPTYPKAHPVLQKLRRAGGGYPDRRAPKGG